MIQRLENMGFQRENVRKLGEEPWINDGKLAGALEHGWIMTFHILGMSSSQLTNSYFLEGLKPPTRYPQA